MLILCGGKQNCQTSIKLAKNIHADENSLVAQPALVGAYVA